MRKELLFSILALLLFASEAARAQDDTSPVEEHKYEIGMVYTIIDLEGFGEPVSGLGGRFAYNFNKHLALDAEASLFPRRHLGNDQTGQKAQGFIGVKAGARSKYVGVFAKARPGAMFIGEVISGFDCNRTSFGQTCRPEHSHFALDVGGVLEFYPSSRTIIRVDAGDTIVRINSATRGFFSPSQSSSDITHNAQFTISFGYRF